MPGVLKRDFYRETVEKSGVADGDVIRPMDGAGACAHVRLLVRALERGKGTVFAWNAGTSIPETTAGRDRWRAELFDRGWGLSTEVTAT